MELSREDRITASSRMDDHPAVLMRGGNPFTIARVADPVHLIQTVSKWSDVIGEAIRAAPSQNSRLCIEKKQPAASLSRGHREQPPLWRPVDTQAVAIELN